MPFNLRPRFLFSLLALLSCSVFPLAALPQRLPLEPTTSSEVPFPAGTPWLVGDHLFFFATDPLFGTELWQSDGSFAGSRRLTDFCPGKCSLQGTPIFMADRIFLVQYDYWGQSLYEVVGDQVSLVARLRGYLKSIVTAGNELFIDLVSADGRETLYRSSGAAGDLREVETICLTQGIDCDFTQVEALQDAVYYLKGGYLRRLLPGGEPQDLIQLERARIAAPLPGGRFLLWGCSGFDSGTCSIFSSDGTPAGTVLVAPDVSRSLVGLDFTTWNGFVYWIDGQKHLVRSDGTSGGTAVLAIAAEDLIGATPTHLFFTRLGATSRDIRLHSLTTAGVDVELLAYDYFDPQQVGVLGNAIFLAYNGQTLHVSNGTPAGTRLLNDLYATPLERPAPVFGGRLYTVVHRLSSPATGGLWVFDEEGNGQPFGSRTKIQGDNAKPFALAGGSLVAAIDRENDDPASLWRVDAQTYAATRVAAPPLVPLLASGDRLLAKTDEYPDLYYGVTSNGVELLPVDFPGQLAASTDGKFYWGKSSPGQVLWESDGSAAGTRQIFDFSPGWTQIPSCSRHCAPSHPSSLRVVGDDIYLVAAAAPGGDPFAEAAVWVYHRGSGEAVRLTTFDEGPNGQSLQFFPVADKVVFALGDAESRRALWVTDGTAAGTRKVLDTDLSFIDFLAAVGGRVFFAESGFPSRLWVSDLTAAGTHLLLARPDFSLDTPEVAVADDHFFFVAATDDLGRELWTSDGTLAGTRPLDLRPGALGSQPESLLGVGNRLILAADRGDGHGHELYQSDGTLVGTSLLADIAPGVAPSSPDRLVAAGERIFFRADDGTTGRGLWALDLPAPRPACPADKLCLHGGRFEAEVAVRHGGPTGKRVLTTEESGVFSFFSPDNWELLVKVLDGCAINGHFWVYSAGATDVPYILRVQDRFTGATVVYAHPIGGPAKPSLDSAALATCEASPRPAAYSAILPVAAAAPRCSDDPEALCFGAGGRFRAKVNWQTASAGGSAHPAPSGSDNSGLFTFFSPSNWELMVKVLDGCAINGKYWVYVAGTTDVGWQLTVEDRVTGTLRDYQNSNGNAHAAVTDSNAFSGCP